MKIKEQTRKLAAGCSKHCFLAAGCSKHCFEVVWIELTKSATYIYGKADVYVV
ncbi:hypothetical protein [Streptococcus pneumoniae]|uniref:hypothetical protein n=1 Tax=Streptococcus pneumoniae TaxID=1313 RepID=UPI00214DDABD|nr:hypothetical protein [Streptococcus pneumoniae]